MRRIGIGMAAAALTLTGPGLSGTPAGAQVDREPACYEIIGCPSRDVIRRRDIAEFSCQLLWDVRNRIYYENFYCFRTQRGIENFGNEGCRFDDQASVPLNPVERRNVATIRAVEQEKGCR
jgi:hypothetical protein